MIEKDRRQIKSQLLNQMPLEGLNIAIDMMLHASQENSAVHRVAILDRRHNSKGTETKLQ
jgi:hypothetical protein